MLDGDRVIVAPLPGHRPAKWGKEKLDVAILESSDKFCPSAVLVDPWGKEGGKIYCPPMDRITPATSHEFLTMQRGLQ